jgi:peptidyl-dipeptidase Dcp
MWSKRGEITPEKDNKPVALEILRLRAEQASMHGYPSFGAYNVADNMAKTPSQVNDLLTKVWKPAKVAAMRERKALEENASVLNGGGDMVIEPWDWRYYAERVRKDQYAFDEEKVKPYLKLEFMMDAIFDVANKLFQLSFDEIKDVATYHPDVTIFEVTELVEGQKKTVAVLIMDPYARAYKQSGAWMSEYRSQSIDASSARVVPIVVCNCNFIKPEEGAPTLLSYDDAITLFHEFGHCCHGMLSNVRYKRQAGTSVLRDFVELPSQLFEHWLLQPEVLKTHARHWKDETPIVDDLVAQLKAAQKFGQGFAAVEYLSCALLDQRIHQLSASELASLDLDQFEKKELGALEMPQGIILRHRLPHFQHLFSCAEYAAGYYVYQWAEVLDADCFAAFSETGNCFDVATAARLRRCIYEVGSSVEPGEAFRQFRGRDPSVVPMLKKKLDIDEDQARDLGLI